MKSNFRKITSIFLVGMLLFLAIGAEFAHTNCFSFSGASTSVVEKSQDDSSPPAGSLGALCIACLFHAANTATLQSFHVSDTLQQIGIVCLAPTSSASRISTIYFSLRAPPAIVA